MILLCTLVYNCYGFHKFETHICTSCLIVEYMYGFQIKEIHILAYIVHVARNFMEKLNLQSWTNCVGKYQKHENITVIPTE